MLKYLTRRVLMGIVTLLLLSSITFVLMKAVPGSPFQTDKFMDPAIIEMMNEKYGLNDSVPEQYFRYMSNVFKGDFGESLVRKQKEVSDIILTSAPVTMKLGLVAFSFAMVVGITLGMTAALTKKTWVKNVVMIIVTSGVSVPSFLLALGLMMVFGVELGWFPLIGLKTPAHYVMPVLALSLNTISVVARLVKSSMTEVLKQDYMTLAKAKGCSKWTLYTRHALKNALLPVVTYAGPALAYLMTGSFVIENLFSIPGIGAEFVSSITNRDYTIIMGITLFLGFFIIVANIVSDIIAAMIDPRIKLSD